MNFKFYYLRDKAKRPLVTVCLAADTNGRFYRGVAICSPKDNPIKRVGRQIARGRVLRAMERKVHSDIVLRDEAWSVLHEVKALNHYYIKSTNNPVLTSVEIKLIKGEMK